jgi:hypothetical protein
MPETPPPTQDLTALVLALQEAAQAGNGTLAITNHTTGRYMCVLCVSYLYALLFPPLPSHDLIVKNDWFGIQVSPPPPTHTHAAHNLSSKSNSLLWSSPVALLVLSTIHSGGSQGFCDVGVPFSCEKLGGAYF